MAQQNAAQALSVVSVSLDDLPATAKDLIAQIGLPAAVALITTWPGIKFPVPVGVDNNPAGVARFLQLAEVVGDSAARVIVREYGPEGYLYIPSCKKAIIRARNRQIVANYSAGALIMNLALLHRLSYRSIELILKKTDSTAPALDNQADLFA